MRDELLDQGRRIDAINATYADADVSFRVLKSIEMDVFEDGSGDMDADVLAGLDLVLGAFHSKLRVTTDATDRYLAALANPTVHVLAHPKARMYGRRAGLVADWSKVFDEAARLGKAVELDATPNRQDLNVEMATIANASGVQWFSMGTDAHSPNELKNLPFAMAIAVQAGIPLERFLNYRTADEVREWARGAGGAMKPDDVEISRPTKLLWPEPEITKQVYADYLMAVADLMVPWLRDRPVTLVRAPDGVEAQRYFQKDTPKYAPDVDPNGGDRGAEREAGRALHGLRRRGDPAVARQPGGARVPPGPGASGSTRPPRSARRRHRSARRRCVRRRRRGRGARARGARRCGSATTREDDRRQGAPRRGADRTPGDQDALRAAAAHLTAIVVERRPELVTDEFRKAKRGGRVMLDPSRNGLGATIVALYSPRARPEATVSFPVVADELASITPADFTIATVPALLDGPGPRAWADGAAARAQRLPARWTA